MGSRGESKFDAAIVDGDDVLLAFRLRNNNNQAPTATRARPPTDAPTPIPAFAPVDSSGTEALVDASGVTTASESSGLDEAVDLLEASDGVVEVSGGVVLFASTSPSLNWITKGSAVSLAP